MTDQPTTGTAATADVERVALQRRTVRVLFTGVVPAGAANTAAFSSAALLGKELTDNGFLGTLAAATVTIGGAAAAVPIANRTARLGRRPGILFGWLVAMAGAALGLAAAIAELYPLLLAGGLAIGFGTATTLSARYGAADLAPEHDRAKAIGMLVWAGSFGSVLGPTLGLGWARTAASWIGLPRLAGPYVMATILYGLAALWIHRRLRPDPLVVAGGVRAHADGPRPSLLATFRAAGAPLRSIARHRDARLAATAMLVGHGVMVGIMTATPLHMDDGRHELQIVGLVISLHIVGMYFFAPLVGWLVDRVGSRTVIAAGGLTLFTGAELAAHTHAEDSTGVFVGLFLVGLGWSFGLVAGSSLLTSAFPVADRVPVQGAADLLMSGAGAAAALTAGLLYELASYHALSHYAGLAAVGLACLTLWSMFAPRRRIGPAPLNPEASTR